MYDTHIHTNCSHDSNQTIDEICLSAISKGLKAVSLTDHVDLLVYSDEKNRNTLLGTAECTRYAKKTYGDKLEIFAGIEIAMPILDMEKSKHYIDMVNADIVLGSVHSFMAGENLVRFPRDDLSEAAISVEDLYKHVGIYYENILALASKADIDVLCHLTYPIRYTNQKYGRNIEISVFSDILTEILKTIITRNIALEANTAKIEDNIDDLSPTCDILKQYYDMGGRMVTLGSDAHVCERIGNSFQAVKAKLADIGFDSYVYFKNRKPMFVSLS